MRQRLFHNPGNDSLNLPNTLEQARQARALGIKFLLNCHYSDTWADPKHQHPPAAWKGLEGAELEAAVRDYTRDSMVAFREAGVMPGMVQNGNEISVGMLWPHGRLAENWEALASLVRAGIEGVEAGRGDAPRPEILVQIERSGSWTDTKWFFDHFLE
ncbi:MAG: hypothetical protein EA425_06315 [Puniceicoccaceae bacterium]|nr:MAG: hypothetical protein EA425_06315 [Puniceicoccaceae bacterium]